MTDVSEPAVLVSRIQVRGFASIATCDVTLGPLTVLVGFNAAGKSNVVDALRFVVDALATSPGRALSTRGGLERVLHRAAGHADADSFSIELELRIGSADGEGRTLTASYGFEIGRDRAGRSSHAVLSERCRWSARDADGARSAEEWNGSAGRTDRLSLPVAAVQQSPLAAVESALLGMRFYELDSAVLRHIDDDTDRQAQLGPHGEHIGQVLGSIAAEYPDVKEHVDSYLRSVVPQSLGVDERREGTFSTIQARFWSGDAGLPFWRAVDAGAVNPDDPRVEVFRRQELSEGTVRAAGALAALFQPDALTGAITLIAIEEPETAIHPSSVGALYDAAYEASRRTQVIVTTQSADLLDSEHADASHLLVVEMVNGATRVGPVDERTRRFFAEQPSQLAELHRQGQLRPAPPLERGTVSQPTSAPRKHPPPASPREQGR